MKPLIFCLLSVGLATAVNSCPIGVNCNGWNTFDSGHYEQELNNMRYQQQKLRNRVIESEQRQRWSQW